MQIILGGIIAGAMTFLGVVLVFRDAAPGDHWVVSYLAVGMALANVPLSFVVPSFISLQQLEIPSPHPANPSPDSADHLAPLLALYQTRLIIRAAIFEGAILLCLIAYLIEGHRVTLVAAAALVAIMLLQFPLVDRVETWLIHELENRKQLRHISRN